MKRTYGRRGFTLVELVVVLAIILVLVGLLSAAVRMVIVRGAQLRDRNDIMQLDMAVQAFKTTFGFYPPSQFLLGESQNDYQNKGQLGTDSLYYLSTMFPRFAASYLPSSPSYYDWNGDGKDTVVTLYGDQCLVWFLGGPGGLNGFSTNPANPGAKPATVGETRYGPFYEFQANRLVVIPANGSNYPSYYDSYKQNPYLYFSAYNRPNSYNRYGSSDVNSKVASVSPYYQVNTSTNVQFWKPNSYQIISAGRNGYFCIGGKVYTPGNAALNLQNGITDTTDTATVPSDDQTNFSSGLLGGGS